MSINPVPATGYIDTAAARDAAAHIVSSPAPQPQNTSPPDLGSKSKQEIGAAKSQPASSPMPQDEVRVQRDEDANNQIVIKYVDASGNLILQIPSSQVLGLARAIEQALQEQTQEKSRKAEGVGPQPGPGGKS